MSALHDRRTSRTLPALMVLLTLVWLVSVAAPAPSNGPAAHVAAAPSTNGRAAMTRQHWLLGGLVANRRDKPGRYGPTLLGMQTRALERALLVAAASGSPATVRPGQQTELALADARAPPLLRLA